MSPFSLSRRPHATILDLTPRLTPPGLECCRIFAHLTMVTYVLPFMIIDVQEYIAADGSCPHEKWFNSLNAQAAAKVAIAITRISARVTIPTLRVLGVAYMNTV